MLEYDAEAAQYDRTRGGLPRAQEAAAAVLRLAPASGRFLDIAGGTGIVSNEIAAGGPAVYVLDASLGMLRKAAERLPGREVQGDARRLPIADASVDVVTAIWILHLIDESAAVIGEAARVLRRGGMFVTTVDKAAGHGHPTPEDPSDGLARVSADAASWGMRLSGTTSFAGLGQLRPDGTTPTFTVAAFTKL